MLYMIVLVTIAGFMHIRQAQKRQRAVTVTDELAFAAGSATAAATISGPGKGPYNGEGGGANGPPVERDDDDVGGRGGDKEDSFYDGPTELPPGPQPSVGTPFQTSSAARASLGSGGGPRESKWGPVASEDGLGPLPSTVTGGDLKGNRTWLSSLFSADTMRESRPTLFAPNSAAADDPKAAAAAAAAAAARAAARRPYRFWVSDILKLLITHLQLLGLLRGLRINWPEGVDVAAWLSFFDQTSTVSSWVSLDCSLGEDEPGAAVRRSVKRTLGLLLMPIVGTLVGMLFWGLYALGVHMLRRRRPELQRLTWRTHYQPRIILTTVLVMFYLYPQVSNAVVSIFACTQLDASASVRTDFVKSTTSGVTQLTLLGDALVANATNGYWNQDTAYVCLTGAHTWLFGLGIVWVVGFCIGFPVAMVVVLYLNRRALEECMVDLRYGFFYDSYDPKYYFWESVVLVEKLLMVIAITLLQRYNATVQVLVALIIISLATVLQITFRPSGCAMLHTLQRSSLFVLQCTLFMLMLSNLQEVADPKVVLAALGIAAALNLLLVAMFLLAFGIEGRRLMLVTVGKSPNERLLWSDVTGFLHKSLFGACGGGAARGANGRGRAARAATPAAPQRQVPTVVVAKGADQV